MSSSTVSAAVFMSGNSQAIRLPKAFQFKSKRVLIERRGDEVILREAAPPALTMKEFLEKMPPCPDWPDIGDEGPAEPVDAW